jgi:transposase InsO family protein
MRTSFNHQPEAQHPKSPSPAIHKPAGRLPHLWGAPHIHGELLKLWGAPHIHGELLKLGFEVAQSTVARYMCRHSRPPSQGWRTFLSNHADGIAAFDLFILPTIAFRILYCLVIIRHGRRILVSFGVTANPTAEWISRQITEAFPWDHAPRYFIRDRDTSCGPVFVQRLRAMGIRDRPIAFRSPWQNAYVERLIGSIRRECLDHMIVFGEAHLRRILDAYAAYYNEARTHRSLNKVHTANECLLLGHVSRRTFRRTAFTAESRFNSIVNLTTWFKTEQPNGKGKQTY